MLGLHWEELLRETYLNASMVVIVILIPHREPVARLPRSSDVSPRVPASSLIKLAEELVHKSFSTYPLCL